MTTHPQLEPIRIEDLIREPSQRLAVALCADVSSSMAGTPIEDLNRAVAVFFAAMAGGAITRASVETAIVAFATTARTVLDFQSLKRIQEPPSLEVDGALGYTTHLGLGVEQAVTLLERRKLEYQVTGVDYFQPILVLLTDAFASDGAHLAVAARIRELEAARGLVMLPIGIGPTVDLELLSLFSARNQPLHLKEQAFDDFFAWLVGMVKQLSKSRPGEGVRYQRPDRQGWIDLS